MNEQQISFEGPEYMPEGPEYIPITDDQVIETLCDKGKENRDARALFDLWDNQRSADFEDVFTTEGGLAGTLESFRYDLRIVRIYYKAGYVNEAVEHLTDTEDSIYNATLNPAYGPSVLEIHEQALDLLNKMKAGETIESS